MKKEEAERIVSEVMFDTDEELALYASKNICNNNIDIGLTLCELILIRGQKTKKIKKSLTKEFLAYLIKNISIEGDHQKRMDSVYTFLLSVQRFGILEAINKTPEAIKNIDVGREVKLGNLKKNFGENILSVN